MTKYYCFNEPIYEGNEIVGNQVIRWTREQVLDYYWKYWNEKMNDVMRIFPHRVSHMLPLMTEESCLDDFLVVNWGWIEDVE